MKRLARIVARVVAAVVVALVVVVGVALAATWASDRPVSALEPRWAPPPSTFVEVDGMRVHLRDQGPRDDPAPLVLLHGTSASLHTWEGWVRALAPRKRVITFDLPAFGLTGPAPDGDYSIPAYVRFVDAVLRKLNVDHFVIGGNSLGGRIAWATALAFPTRVEKLILVDSAGYPLHATSIPIGFRIARLPVLNRLLEHSLPRGVVEDSVRNVYGDPSKVDAALVDRYYDLTLREGNRHALGQRMRLAPDGDRAAEIPGLKLPTLIIWGGRDHLIPSDDAQRFHHDIAGSQLVIFDDLGHVPHEEDPARTVVPVERFLGL
jgi:pimeloyl-ACP methyl ester carboxylesterase